MKLPHILAWVTLSLCICCCADAPGRGFGGGGGFHGGGFGGGGFGGGGFHGGSFGGSSGFDHFNGGSYGGADRFSGFDNDRLGGNISADHFNGFDTDRFNGLNGLNQNFSTDRIGGWGGDRYNAFDNRAVDRPETIHPENIRPDNLQPAARNPANWQSAFANTRFPTDSGLAHFSQFNAASLNHVTNNWSHNAINNRANFVRNNFNYYNCFHGDWWAHHPGSWFVPGWAAGWAWRTCTWPWIIGWWGIPAVPVYYDYGDNIVYQNNYVYVDGQNVGTAQAYAQQATTLADQGQQANPPTTEEWQPLGVFALVQGQETNSNNLFQLAVNKQGIIRGNYYDGVMDTTTPVYGSVDKKTQRAAWTIGKSNDRVFEAGVYNLTKPQTPVLVHFGADRTQQWLLVRVEQPASSGSSQQAQ